MIRKTPTDCGVKMAVREFQVFIGGVCEDFGYPLGQSDVLMERPLEALKFVQVAQERLYEAGVEVARELPDEVIPPLAEPREKESQEGELSRSPPRHNTRAATPF